MDRRKNIPDRDLQRFATNKSWYMFHAIAIAWVVGLIMLDASDAGRYLKSRVSDATLFHTRDAMGQYPKLTDKLKVIALDDASFSYLGGPRLSASQLTTLIRSIEKRKPKAIIIDALLSDRPSGSDEDISALQALSVDNIYSGAFASSAKVAYRPEVDLDKPIYSISGILSSGDASSLKGLEKLDTRLGSYVYGPWPKLQDVIKAQGHVTYNKNNSISPLIRVSNEHILPHISMLAADNVRMGEKRLYVNDYPVRLNKNGAVPINFRHPEDFYQTMQPLYRILQRAEKGVPETSINEGDIVLLVLAFATGNTDFHEVSPYGEVPGSLIIASMLSDIVTKSWLSEFEISFLLIIFAALLGTIIGINSSAFVFWFAVLSIGAIYFILVTVAFSFAQLILPWLLPLGSFFGSALIYFALIRLQEEMKFISVERSYFEEKALRLERENQKAKLEGYLALGKATQTLLLPKKMTGIFSHFRYQFRYTPNLKMAGDWAFVWPSSNGQVRFFFGDVMGKGPSAAIPVASIITLLHDCKKRELDTETTIHLLNTRMIELFNSQLTSTLSVACLNPDGTGTLYNAGGPGWFIWNQKNCDMHRLRGTPLGLSSRLKLSRARVRLTEGDSLFSFTDGYIESSREIRRLIRSLDTKGQKKLSSDIIHRMLVDAQSSDDHEDDKTFLAVEYFEKEGDSSGLAS